MKALSLVAFSYTADVTVVSASAAAIGLE